MGKDDARGAHHHNHSDTELVGADRTTAMAFSTPMSSSLNKRTSRKAAIFNIPENTATASSTDNAYVEITLDVGENSVAVHSLKTADGTDVEDPQLTLLAKGLEKRSSFGSSIVRNASSKFKQVSQELKRLASLSKRPHQSRFDRTKSAAVHALKGLKFISKTDGCVGWPAVEKRFNELTATTTGLLPRSLFGECIGKLIYVNLVPFWF